jgi:hypothetical protein
MDPLASLLAGGPSELGRLGRAAVAGLRTTLEQGLAYADPTDPHRAAIQAALDYLDHAPKGDAAPSIPSALELLSPSHWPRLLAEWQARPDGQSLAKLADDASDLPKQLWLFTCRLAPLAAAGLRAEWHAAAPEAVPPTPGEPPPGRQVATPATPIAQRMADVVNRLLWYVENDPALWHILRSVYRFGLIELKASQRDRYVQALLGRYESLRQAEEAGDSRGVLTGWVDLDEAAHSLVHQPVAHPQSDFARVAAACRDASGEVRDLAAGAGLQFHFQCPSGRYADLKGQTDADTDVATDLGGVPGEVVLCVRLFLKLDDVRHPGRLIYRTR